ncbi:ABC transporter ATP-binding protein [Chelatococcus sp. GCM10030263]|uniref:ABC transporter ATP-binding protein n=1 Tax=Chelatococcus sp. GCM10030263 TaxID=3273387 RepID=UPI00360E2678
MSGTVEVLGVSKHFAAHRAVDDISFVVESGEFFSLLGPSGCGKSTTLRMLSGFEAPDCGSIRIAGQDMTDVPPYRRPTNIVFQRWALFPHMTAEANIAFGLEAERLPKPEIRRRVGAALELVGLTDLGRRKPAQLSGGQMQRVALARALVKRPKVLLLDEPLSALDLKLRHQMQIELKRIQQETGTTFIFVTHDQGEALAMSDQVAVMNAGRIEQIASPQTLYDAPATRFVASFIGHANLLPVSVVACEGETARVAFAGQEFACIVGEAPQGREGLLVLRFELVRIAGPGAALAASIKGTVRQAIFAGSTVQYVVRLNAGDIEMTVEQPYGATGPLIAQGEAVTLGWNAGDGRLFPA